MILELILESESFDSASTNNEGFDVTSHVESAATEVDETREVVHTAR